MSKSHLLNLMEKQKMSDGQTMYDHIKKLVYRISKNETKLKGYDHFEILSQLLKSTNFLTQDYKFQNELEKLQEPAQIPDWQNKTEELYNQAITTAKKISGAIIPDIINDFKLFELGGISFGEEEVYKLDKSLKQLQLKYQPKGIRFWGKIFGLEHDYYVIEGNIKEESVDEVPLKTEPKGTGINKLTFWVTNDLLEPWVELPVISPEFYYYHYQLNILFLLRQLNKSRQVKYVFTGNLNKEVQSYPVFPGQEKHFLKAQIIRITCSCVVAPSGQFKVNDENDKEIEFEEEFKMQEFAELQNLANWVHLNPNILLSGRITHYEDMTLNEEDRNAQLEDLNTNDPVIERLKPISDDKRNFVIIFFNAKAVEPFEANWLVRTYGETQNFNQVGRDADNGTVCYALHMIRNLTWPGAFFFAQQNKYANIYIGNGMKGNLQQSFVPLAPNDLQIETVDQIEHPEPNGKDPKIVAAEMEAERLAKLKEEEEAKALEQQDDE